MLLLLPLLSTIRICLLLYLTVEEVDCCVVIRPGKFTIIIVFFTIISPLFRLIVACYSSFSTPISRRHFGWLLCGFVWFLWSLCTHQSPDTCLQPWQCFDRCGGWIDTPDTAAGSEGIHEGVGWVWGGWGRMVDLLFIELKMVRQERWVKKSPPPHQCHSKPLGFGSLFGLGIRENQQTAQPPTNINAEPAT